MRKLLLTLAVAVMSAVTAMAQYEVSIEKIPNGNYLQGTQSFPLAEMAEKLGFEDAAALAAAYEAGPLVWGTLPDGSESNEYTSEGQGFWMNGEGKIVYYGDEALWYAFVSIDTDNEALVVNVGMMPNTADEGASYTSTLTLKNGESSVTINVTETLIKKPETGEIITALPLLNVVKTYEGTVQFEAGGQYEGKPMTIDVEDICAQLGISEETLSATLNNRLYGPKYNYSNAYGYEKDDTLRYLYDGDLGGWFGLYEIHPDLMNEDITIVEPGLMNWSVGCTAYFQTPEYANGVLTFNSCGQYPGTLKDGDTAIAPIYIISEDKAVLINVNIVVKAKDISGNPDTEEWEMKGESTVTQNTALLANYLQIDSPIENMAEILEALGAESADELTFYLLASEGDTRLDDKLDDGWGTWVGANGVWTGWNDNAAVMIAFSKLEDGNYGISTLQMLNQVVIKANKNIAFPAYLANTSNGTYWKFNFEYNYNEPKSDLPQSEWTKVIDFLYPDIQLVPDTENYALAQKTVIDMQAAAEQLGCDASVLQLFADCIPAEGEENPDSIFSNVYSCDPAPGFWIKDIDGKMYAGNWGNSGPIGMTFASDGTITWYNKPGSAEVGTNYTANFYLVNLEESKYVRLLMNIELVSDAAETEIVATDDVTFVLDENSYSANDDNYQLAIDLETVLPALGLTDISEMESCVWYARNKAGRMAAIASFEGEDCVFNASGATTTWEDEDAVFSLGWDYDLNLLTCSLFGEEPSEEDTYETEIALGYEGKMYVFNVTIGSAQATSINSIATGNAMIKISDLSGRTLNAPVKGINIINGTKVLVK